MVHGTQIAVVEIVMGRAILPQLGERDIASLRYEAVQAALNHMAEMPLLIGKGKKRYTRIRYGQSAIKRARTCMRATFELASMRN